MKKIIVLLLLCVLVSPVWAQAKYSIKQMTPEVQSALNNRRDRFEQLRSLKATGDVGENANGYVVGIKSSSAADALVNAENNDRRIIYQTIADQNGLSSDIAAIEKVFGQVQADKAQPGDKIQAEDGSWSAK